MYSPGAARFSLPLRRNRDFAALPPESRAMYSVLCPEPNKGAKTPAGRGDEMRSMRRATRSLSLAAIATVGLTAGAAAQLLGPGMPLPGQGPPMGMGGFPTAPQQQREPPCMG